MIARLRGDTEVPTDAGLMEELPLPEVTAGETDHMEMPSSMDSDPPTEDSETLHRAFIAASIDKPSPDPLSGPIDELPGPPHSLAAPESLAAPQRRDLAPGETPPVLEELEDSKELAPYLASTPARGLGTPAPVATALAAAGSPQSAAAPDPSDENTIAFDPSQFVRAAERDTLRFGAPQLNRVNIPPIGRPTELSGLDDVVRRSPRRSKDAEMAIQSSLAGLAVVILVVILVGSFLFFYQMNQVV